MNNQEYVHAISFTLLDFWLLTERGKDLTDVLSESIEHRITLHREMMVAALEGAAGITAALKAVPTAVAMVSLFKLFCQHILIRNTSGGGGYGSHGGKQSLLKFAQAQLQISNSTVLRRLG
jgi:hypothetical protein